MAGDKTKTIFNKNIQLDSIGCVASLPEIAKTYALLPQTSSVQ